MSVDVVDTNGDRVSIQHAGIATPLGPAASAQLCQAHRQSPGHFGLVTRSVNIARLILAHESIHGRPRHGVVGSRHLPKGHRGLEPS